MSADFLHRVLSGQSLTRAELIGAGVFVIIWFAMDVVQFVGWIIEKLG